MKITIWTGGSARPWGPDTLKTGIGGSETAAVHLSHELALLGHDVAVVGAHRGHEKNVIGHEVGNTTRKTNEGPVGAVFWVDAFEADGATLAIDRVKPYLACDAFISLRLKNAINLFPSLGIHKPKFTALWCQDLHCGSDWDGDVQAFDETWALTEFHRDFLLNFYTRLTPEKTWTTRNGLDLSRFVDVYERKDFNHFTWSSSLDRGLEALLDLWPQVRGRLPKAELHVYYGPPVVPAHLQKDPVVERCWLMVERLACMKRHGVHYHGRAGQDEVAESHKRSAFWLYPTDFQETSCQPPGSLVFTKDGAKKIEDVKEGDMVLTHMGRFRKVTALVSKHHDGEMFAFRRAKDKLPVMVTGEHPIYAATFNRRSDSKGNRIYGDKYKKVSWKLPHEMKVKVDHMVSPRTPCGSLRKIRLSDYVDMPVDADGMISRNHSHRLWKKTKDEVDLDDDLMFLLGIFAADGCVSSSRQSSKRSWYSTITFAVHSKQRAIARNIVKFFGGGSITLTSPNGLTVQVHSSPWANFLKNVIGTGVDKRFPPFLWDCPADLQKAFAAGLFYGDGHTSLPAKGRKKPNYSYTSISPSLAYGFAFMMSAQGNYPSVHYAKSRGAYVVEWTQTPKTKFHREMPEGFATQVRKIEKTHYVGPVFNIEVEEDESYVTNRTIVHNCITAMEAQAAGAVPICTAYGSLPEVAGGVHHVPGTCSTGSPPDLVARSWEPSYVPRGASPRGWLLPPPGRGKGWGEGLGLALGRLVGKDGVGTEEWCLRSEACREWALKQSWAGIAREWGEHLKEKTGVW